MFKISINIISFGFYTIRYINTEQSVQLCTVFIKYYMVANNVN